MAVLIGSTASSDYHLGNKKTRTLLKLQILNYIVNVFVGYVRNFLFIINSNQIDTRILHIYDNIKRYHAQATTFTTTLTLYA